MAAIGANVPVADPAYNCGTSEIMTVARVMAVSIYLERYEKPESVTSLTLSACSRQASLINLERERSSVAAWRVASANNAAVSPVRRGAI